MCAMVIMSFLVSLPHLWVDMLGEGSPSLNLHLICLLAHQSYNTQMVDNQWRPAYVSCLWFSRLFGQSCKMVLLIFCGGVCVMYMVSIYYDLWKNFCMTRICCVGCLVGSSMCLTFCDMMCCGMWVSDRT